MGLDYRSLSWIILVDHKSNEKCPWKCEAEGDLTWRKGGSDWSFMTTSQGMSPAMKSWQQREKNIKQKSIP